MPSSRPRPASRGNTTNDAVRQFATEGTPVALSHAGSNTNLSTLTMDDDNNPKTTQVEPAEESSDGDDALLECLQIVVKKTAVNKVKTDTKSLYKHS
jgi:hypothetical protein